jgi:hypothetical protein
VEVTATAPCVDCGKDCRPHNKKGRPLFANFDEYIVRGEIWRAAGMNGWASGFLCRKCLARRLGRDLVEADFLVRMVVAGKRETLAKIHSDYLTSPEYLDHGGSSAAAGLLGVD